MRAKSRTSLLSLVSVITLLACGNSSPITVPTVMATSTPPIETISASPVAAASANTYYVSVSGNDNNPGTQTQPWRTIQKAANMLNAGDTSIVLAGNYQERVKVVRSGIKFEANGLVEIQGFYITANDVSVRGFSISNSSGGDSGIYAKGSNIVIEQNIINDVPGYGIELLSTNSTIKGNTVAKGRNSGIWVSGQNNLIENNDVSTIIQPTSHANGGDANCMTFFGSGHIFTGNYCHDIYSDGALVTDAHIDGFQTWDWASAGGVGHDILFEKNVIMLPIDGKGWDIEQGAYNITMENNIAYTGLIVLIIDGKNISFINNTFVGTGSGSDGLHLLRTEANLYNNIFAHQRQRVIENIDSSATITASNNCYIDYGIMLSAHSGDVRNTDALFVNESLGDYHLQPNSPCIDKGITDPRVVEDKDGISRPQGSGYDMGAFEFLDADTAASTPVPPTNTAVPTASPLP